MPINLHTHKRRTSAIGKNLTQREGRKEAIKRRVRCRSRRYNKSRVGRKRRGKQQNTTARSRIGESERLGQGNRSTQADRVTSRRKLR